MKNEHVFIFTKGIWLGEGIISFKASPETIPFYTKWKIEEIKDGIIHAEQIVEMQGIQEKTVNTYTIALTDENAFSIQLMNENVQNVQGKGVLAPDIITWNFNADSIEGFEVYEMNNDGYSFHAEYAREDFFRTIIDGVLWRKEGA